MIAITIFNIIAVALLGVFFARFFEPLQKPKQYFINIFSFSMILYDVLNKVLNCSKCMSFWLSLFFFRSLLAAVTVSFLAYLINHVIDRIEEWYQ